MSARSGFRLVDAYGVSISEGTAIAGQVGHPDLEIDRVLARLACRRITPRCCPLLSVFTPVRLPRRQLCRAVRRRDFKRILSELQPLVNLYP